MQIYISRCFAGQGCQWCVNTSQDGQNYTLITSQVGFKMQICTSHGVRVFASQDVRVFASKGGHVSASQDMRVFASQDVNHLTSQDA